MFLALICAASASPMDSVDWSAATDEAAAVLSRYLAIDTSNLPGNETEGAYLLAGYAEQAGLPYVVEEIAPGRSNLTVTLQGDGSVDGALCLVSHIDVATVEAHNWVSGHAPFSGDIDADGTVWGRGALDMKTMGVLELQAMVALKRQGVVPARDVILVAVADEEVDNTGIQHWIATHWDTTPCAYVFNEGGIGIQDLLFEDQTVYPITVGEKGVLWLRMTATGTSGHGSTPILDTEAPETLIRAMNRIRAQQADAEPIWHPALLELLHEVGRSRAFLERFVLTRPSMVRTVLKPQLMGNPLTRAAITNTFHITGFEGANQPNVVPSQVSALLDCRLQPGVTPEDALAELTEIVSDPRIEFEVISAQPAAVSEWHDDPVFNALRDNVLLQDPDGVVGPAISVGFTDSIYLREAGARAYGMVPMSVSQEQAATMHGPDEHVTRAQLEMGVQTLARAVYDVAVSPASSASSAE